MSGACRTVSNAAELTEAAARPNAGPLSLMHTIDGLSTLRLAPGVSLRGQAGAALRFAPGQDGLCLTADNEVTGLELATDPDRPALFNDTGAPGFGRLVLTRLRLTGCLRVLAEGAASGGHVEAHDIVVLTADARGYNRRPKGYGVEVIPGAFTLWNLQTSTESLVTADLTGIVAGRAGAPVRGSGIFVGGTPAGGRTLVRRLETGEVYSHGGIAPGTADRISGGVFVVSGATVEDVRNRGSVTTYGPNDMVLDNWGTVERWHAEAKITSFGPSAIGFVNFGTIGTLRVDSVIETHGAGARGFNVYDGTLRDAEFERVVTRADGAVGIQISRPVGRIVVKHGIETFGGTGDSLVKGVITRLAAVPLSIKPGGAVQQIDVRGGVTSHGEGVMPFEHHGHIERLSIEGGFKATGGGFAAL